MLTHTTWHLLLFLYKAGAPNYFPNSFNGPVDDHKHLEHRLKLSGDVNRYDDGDEDNYSQVGDFWSKVKFVRSF